jgi:hypothetical protein
MTRSCAPHVPPAQWRSIISQLKSEQQRPAVAQFGGMSGQVAIKYSGVVDGEMLPIVLEIRTGAVDRGASIRDFSQYQAEVPCEAADNAE